MLSLFLSQSFPGGWPFLVALIILIMIVVPALVAFRGKKARKTSLEQGREGEEEVRLTLERSGQPGIFDNFMLVENGRSRQIDHIVVNSNGVFVIETKNLSGQIYGEEDWQEWTQVLSYGKVKNKFYNPVKQNLTHVRCVQKLLPKGVPVWSLIVFVQNNTAFIRSRGVVALSQLPAVLDQPTGYHLSAGQIEEICSLLAKAQANAKISDEEHVREVVQMRAAVEAGICPRCGGHLVEREGRYGPFYGCENYPKCKFTKKR